LEIIRGNDKIAGTQRKRNIDPLNEAHIPAVIGHFCRWRLVFVLYTTLQANPAMVCKLEKARQAASATDSEAQK
jgi:hypothetical protein